MLLLVTTRTTHDPTREHMELQSILLKFGPKNSHDVKLGLIDKNDGEKSAFTFSYCPTIYSIICSVKVAS